MVSREIPDRRIAESLARVAGLRGYASLTAGAKQALVDVLRKYADSAEHCDSIVENWIETHTEVPTPFDLREAASQVMAPQAAAIAKAATMGRCRACSGTGFDSFDALVYSIEVRGQRRALRRELRLAPLAASELRSLDPRTRKPKWAKALASGNVPDEFLHPSSLVDRDRVALEISAAPQNFLGCEIVALSDVCACRRLAS